MKNSRVSNFDNAYQNYHHSKDSGQEELELVVQVRETFFQMLTPYLSKIPCCIRKGFRNTEANFFKYFNIEKYIDLFDDQVYIDFAKNLVKSSQFIHLCDDYFSEELTNLDMLCAIFKKRGLDTEEDPCSENRDDMKFDVAREFTEEEDDNEPVVFDIRMPQDEQRVMLFDKLQFLIDKTVNNDTENLVLKKLDLSKNNI